MDAERLKEIGYRAQELGKLKEHPSWQVLRDVLDGKERIAKETLARDILRGSGRLGWNQAQPVNQREIDYLRGFWAGVNYLLDNPEQAENALQNALGKATSMEEGDTV